MSHRAWDNLPDHQRAVMEACLTRLAQGGSDFGIVAAFVLVSGVRVAAVTH